MFQRLKIEKKIMRAWFFPKNCKNGRGEHRGFGKNLCFFTPRPVERDD